MLIFAHRGMSAIEPENTLLSIQSAIDNNVTGIEIDIFEIDNKLVVIHDRWLDRTTSGSGLISHASFEQLRQLDAGKGEKIPTLDEVLAILPKSCLLNIELKGIHNITLLLTYIDQAIVKYGITSDQLLLSSFNHHQLKALSTLRPKLSIGALTASLPLDYAKYASTLNAYAAHICISSVNKDFVQDAHQRGLKVFVYTVDEPDDITMLYDMEVDGIFSNNPTDALQHFLTIKS